MIDEDQLLSLRTGIAEPIWQQLAEIACRDIEVCVNQLEHVRSGQQDGAILIFATKLANMGRTFAAPRLTLGGSERAACVFRAGLVTRHWKSSSPPLAPPLPGCAADRPNLKIWCLKRQRAGKPALCAVPDAAAASACWAVGCWLNSVSSDFSM